MEEGPWYAVQPFLAYLRGETETATREVTEFNALP